MPSTMPAYRYPATLTFRWGQPGPMVLTYQAFTLRRNRP
jgi:hypothetical protein